MKTAGVSLFTYFWQMWVNTPNGHFNPRSSNCPEASRSLRMKVAEDNVSSTFRTQFKLEL